MPREIPNNPHPTPNPDGPHTAGPAREGAPVPGPVPHHQESDEENSPYDSQVDDLDVILDQSIHEPVPDPALESRSGSKDVPGAPSAGDPVPPFLKGKANQPRTSEIFKAVAPAANDVSTAAPTRRDDPSLPSLTSDSPDPEATSGPSTAVSGAARVREKRPIVVPGSSTDESEPSEGRVPWMLLVLLIYSTAATLALTWFIVGRKPARDTGQSLEEPSVRVEAPRKEAEPAGASAPLPPIPRENVARLGATIRIGDLEITPLEVSLAQVELLRSIEPPDYRREEAASLVLRIRLRNVSQVHAFAPLEAALIRDQGSPLDRSVITTASGKRIRAYPLAADSEWTIYGQDCPVLSPGASVETLLASEPNAADRIEREQTWRVRVRIGPYRSDILGIGFGERDVGRPAVETNP
jgi:hypothetical protein